jgi:hypothetical protein
MIGSDRDAINRPTTIKSLYLYKQPVESWQINSETGIGFQHHVPIGGIMEMVPILSPSVLEIGSISSVK